jgi:hypothetical protein
LLDLLSWDGHWKSLGYIQQSSYRFPCYLFLVGQLCQWLMFFYLPWYYLGTDRRSEQPLASRSSLVGYLAVWNAVVTTPSRDPDVWYVHHTQI